jgi:hypothetical protein
MKLFELKSILFILICIVAIGTQLYPQVSDLKSIDNQADYLVITTEDFLETIGSLTLYRQSQNLTTQTILTDDIYEQFQDTLSRQEAIRHFVSYALEYWAGPKPQFLLLVGDVEFVPSYKVLSQFHDSELKEDSISIDDHFAINLYEADLYPDIAIGRLPVSTPQQLQNIIDKIIQFETELSRDNYPVDFLGLADYRDNEEAFELALGDFIHNYLPDYYTYQRIDRRNDSPYYGTAQNIIDSIGNGPLFVSYYGHGSPFIWGDSSFFYVDDVQKIISNQLPFILTSLACRQRFDIDDSTSIIEALLYKQNGGAVLTFAPAGFSYYTDGTRILNKFYELLFDEPGLTIGRIIHMTKAYRPITSQDDIPLRFTLLGDPALKLPDDLISAIPEYDNVLPELFTLYQNYPNPFNGSTTIKFQLFSSQKVKLEIYDNKGQKTEVILNEFLNGGLHTVQWEPGAVASGIYYVRLTHARNSKVIRALYIK